MLDIEQIPVVVRVFMMGCFLIFLKVKVLSKKEKDFDQSKKRDAIPELGPVYGQPLKDSIPMGGEMRQALPSRKDLQAALLGDHQRLVAGYEVLLIAYEGMKRIADKTIEAARNKESRFVVPDGKQVEFQMKDGRTIQAYRDTDDDCVNVFAYGRHSGSLVITPQAANHVEIRNQRQ